MEIKYRIQGLSAEVDREAIESFPGVLNQIDPNVVCKVAPLDDGKGAEVTAAIAKAGSFVDCAAAVAEILADEAEPIPCLVISCDANSILAKLAKRDAPHAEWGARCGCLVAIYHHEAATVWHEMLHLLGAEDCYRDGEAADKTCGYGNCIMQYAPTLGVVGDPPFLCEQNVQRIKDQWNKAVGAPGFSDD